MDKKKSIDWRIVCTGLACITILEGIALSQGVNGIVLSITIAIIAAAIGVAIPTDIIKR